MGCPDKRQLKSFLLGGLVSEEIDSVASHCDGCLTCQKSLETLAGTTDTVVDAIRRGMPQRLPFVDETQCSAIMEQVLAEAAIPNGSEEHTVPGNGDRLGQYQILEKLGCRRYGNRLQSSSHKAKADRRFEAAARTSA